MNDTFTKWMLGITAAVIVGVGSALFATIITLREDMAVIKSTVARIEKFEIGARVLEERVVNHEYRLRTLERSTTDVDTTRWRHFNGR